MAQNEKNDWKCNYIIASEYTILCGKTRYWLYMSNIREEMQAVACLLNGDDTEIK